MERSHGWLRFYPPFIPIKGFLVTTVLCVTFSPGHLALQPSFLNPPQLLGSQEQAGPVLLA